MTPSKLFAYLQTEAAEFAIPVVLDVVHAQIHDHRMTRAPHREIGEIECRYYHPPNQGFAPFDSSFGDGWRARRRGAWTEIEVMMGGEKVSACCAPSGDRVLVCDLGDAMREVWEMTGELRPRLMSWTGFRERIPLKPKHRGIVWDRMGRDGDEFDDGERSDETRGAPLWIDFEDQGVLVACRMPVDNDALTTWADLQPAICALMLARLRVRAQGRAVVERDAGIADELLAAGMPEAAGGDR